MARTTLDDASSRVCFENGADFLDNGTELRTVHIDGQTFLLQKTEVNNEVAVPVGNVAFNDVFLIQQTDEVRW